MDRINEWVMDGTDEQDAYAIRNPLLLGDENMGEFWTEHGNVARTFRGQYTIVEIRALLADMVRVQQNLDAADAAVRAVA